MTGELFAHLKTMPTLGKVFGAADSHSPNAFRRGVLESRSERVLHRLFKLRSENLLGKLSANDAVSYLSGLLIGDELAGIFSRVKCPVIIAAAGVLHDRYAEASALLENARVHILESGLVERAVISGHCRILESMLAAGKTDGVLAQERAGRQK
jgi:2-dehydro-3-deoxygalactonokinase